MPTWIRDSLMPQRRPAPPCTSVRVAVYELHHLLQRPARGVPQLPQAFGAMERSNTALLHEVELVRPQDIILLAQILQTEDISYVGFPTRSGFPSCI